MPSDIAPAMTPRQWQLVQLRRTGKLPGGRVPKGPLARIAIDNDSLPDSSPYKITRALLPPGEAEASDEGGRHA